MSKLSPAERVSSCWFIVTLEEPSWETERQRWRKMARKRHTESLVTWIQEHLSSTERPAWMQEATGGRVHLEDIPSARSTYRFAELTSLCGQVQTASSVRVRGWSIIASLHLFHITIIIYSTSQFYLCGLSFYIYLIYTSFSVPLLSVLEFCACVDTRLHKFPFGLGVVWNFSLLVPTWHLNVALPQVSSFVK